MIDWLRRVDPAFYHKEPDLLRARAEIVRYTDEAQAAMRASVLAADALTYVVVTFVALALYVVATGGDALDPRRDWPEMWALAVLAVAAPRTLPWWPRGGGVATGAYAVAGAALVAISALWTRADLALAAVALAVAVALAAVPGRARPALLALAVGVLFGARMSAYPFVAGVLVGTLAAGATVLFGRLIAPVWQLRPQVLTTSALALLAGSFAYAVAFVAPDVTSRWPLVIGAFVAAFLGICAIAGRIRRAELIARPGGGLTSPQSVVPLLDRSYHHAVICWERD